MTETYPAAVVTPPEATGESTRAARTLDVHELRNRIDHVRSWLGKWLTHMALGIHGEAWETTT